MEIVIAVLSWVVPVLLGLLVASVPASLVIEKVSKNWKASKGPRIYRIIQVSLLVAWVVVVGAFLVLTLGS